MGTKNPFDSLNDYAAKQQQKLLLRSNKLDRHLSDAVEAVLTEQPQRLPGSWIFYDDRLKQTHVSETKPEGTPEGRKGQWVYKP